MTTYKGDNDDDDSADEFSHLCAPVSQGEVTIKIKSNESPDIEVDVGAEETVEELKNKIIDRLHIDREKKVRLIHCGKLLEPASKKVLDDFNIRDGAFVHVVVTNQPASAGRNQAAQSAQVATENAGTTETNQGNLRGLDQLTYAGMTADEVQAIRSSFLPLIDEFAEQRNIHREPNESNTAFRFRLEEQWMDEQGPNSEFMMNLPQAAMRYRMIRTLRQLGINPARAFADGSNGLNSNSHGLLFEMMRRNDSSSHDDDDPGMGSRRDLMWGIFLGFFLGFITLICVWDRNIPYRQKMGIMIGVALQMAVGLWSGDLDNSSAASQSTTAATSPISTAPQISPQPVVATPNAVTSGTGTAFFRGSRLI
jgi:hypothetical protein